MTTIYTPEELASKGIKKSDVARMMRRHEKMVNWHAAQYLRQGNQCTQSQRSAWDSACSAWEHAKATLAGFCTKTKGTP